MTRVVRPGRARRRARDHHADAAAAVDFFRLWFDRVVPLLGLAGDEALHVPAELGQALPRARSALGG